MAITPGETDFDDHDDFDKEPLNSTQGLITVDIDMKTVVCI